MPQLKLIIVLTGLLFTFLNASPGQAKTIEYSQPLARYLVDLGSFIRNNYDKEFSFKGVVPNQSGPNNPVMLKLTSKIVSQSKLDRKSNQFQFMNKLSGLKGGRVVYVPKVKINKQSSVEVYAIPIPTNVKNLLGNKEFIVGITTIVIPVFEGTSEDNAVPGCVKRPTKTGDIGELCYCWDTEECKPKSCNPDCPLDEKGFLELSSQLGINIQKVRPLTLGQVKIGESILEAYLAN